MTSTKSTSFVFTVIPGHAFLDPITGLDTIISQNQSSPSFASSHLPFGLIIPKSNIPVDQSERWKSFRIPSLPDSLVVIPFTICSKKFTQFLERMIPDIESPLEYKFISFSDNSHLFRSLISVPEFVLFLFWISLPILLYPIVFNQIWKFL